jgi:saccharopepsin
MYSLYDFGDFDASGHMGNPYVQLLSLVDPNTASKEFAAARGTVPRTNITFNAENSTAAAAGSTTVSLSSDITDTLNKINTFFPIMLAILGLNALVILLLAIAAFTYLYRRRQSASYALKRRTARRLTPMPLEAISTDSFISPRESLRRESSRHPYEPVSMALSEDTFVPPSPAFYHTGFGSKGRPYDDRPKSVA